MRVPTLALVLVLPNALVLAVALNARADRPKQAATRQAPAVQRASQGRRVAAARVSAPSRPRFLAEAVRDEKRLVTTLMRRENRAISEQRRSLLEMGRLMSRNLRGGGRIQTLISATGRRIDGLIRRIQLRERRILGRYLRIDQMITGIRRLAPLTAGLDTLLRRQEMMSGSIEEIERIQSSLGIESLPDTPAFPPGKPAASPVQA
ncbi:hypothetical protein TA3x_005707 (plasmid) [Tundrisphaera sp. TA3]|uniref:hypothetical protein n=1 Tax=Tundrisphaera sp. TA3 TaxID=3435775 RepID=UPI003EB9FF24